MWALNYIKYDKFFDIMINLLCLTSFLNLINKVIIIGLHLVDINSKRKVTKEKKVMKKAKQY